MNTFLSMELFSDRAQGQKAALEQIQALADFEGGLFQPVKCDVGEPLREKFDPNDLKEPVRWLDQPSGRFSFKRLKPFRVEGYISDRRYPKMWTQNYEGGPRVLVVPKFPEPRFTTHWVVWLDEKLLESKGPDLLKKFLIEMFMVSKSEYGFLTAEEDYKSKNFLVLDNGKTVTSKFVGTDPEWGIPGLYWCNVFGSVYTEWLNPKLANIPAKRESLSNGSTLVQFGESPATCKTSEIINLQQRAMNILGRNKFFDLRYPERKVETPFHPILQ